MREERGREEGRKKEDRKKETVGGKREKRGGRKGREEGRKKDKRRETLGKKIERREMEEDA